MSEITQGDALVQQDLINSFINKCVYILTTLCKSCFLITWLVIFYAVIRAKVGGMILIFTMIQNPDTQSMECTND